MSWIAAFPDDERSAFVARIRALIDAGELPVHFLVGLATRA
jgi:hypothetical protein